MVHEERGIPNQGKTGEPPARELPFLDRRGFLKTGVVGFALLSGAAEVGSLLEKVAFADEGKLPLSKGVVVVDKGLCSGCRTCEAVCATFNSRGRTSSGLARIILEKDYAAVEYEPNACFQCVEPLCLPVCPVGAITVDTKSGTNARIIDENECVGCEQCIEACGSVFTPPRPRYDYRDGVSVKCHLCSGDPRCVKYCPYGALQFKWSDAGLQTGYPVVKEG